MLPQSRARGLTVVLVEAGVQQPVAVGVTRQEVHGAVVGSVAPQHRIPLRTRRPIRSRGARAAAAGSEGPRGLRPACVVSATSSVRGGPVRARACARARARAPGASGHKGRGRTEQRGSCGGRWVPRHSHQPGRTDRTRDRVEKSPRQHSCPQHTISRNPRHVPTIHILFDQKRPPCTGTCIFQWTRYPLCLPELSQPSDTSSHGHEFPKRHLPNSF